MRPSEQSCVLKHTVNTATVIYTFGMLRASHIRAQMADTSNGLQCG